MKKVILTFALITSVSMLSIAQNANSTQTNAAESNRPVPPAPEKIAETGANMFKQQLKLTDAQYKAVYQVELDQVKQAESFRTSGQPMGEGPAKQMRMTHDKKFKEILTAEQYEKYVSMTTPGKAPAGAPAPANH